MSLQVTGKVVREDFGPGTFVLVTDDGQRFALKGGDFQAGQQVSVKGKIAQDAMGIGMTNDPVLEVQSVERG